MSRKRSRKTRIKKEVQTSPIIEKKEETSSKEEFEDKNSCFNILREEKNRTLIDLLTDRRFFVSKSYKDRVVYTTSKFHDALTHCPVGYSIFDSEGVKIYPAPQRRTSIKSLYTVKKNRNDSIIKGSYRELQEAINNCPMGYNVYDEEGYKVY